MNELKIFVLISFFFFCFLTSYSQILLKRSAMERHATFIASYFNIKVMFAYGIMFLSTVSSMWAMQYYQYKLISILGNITYIFVPVLSALLLKEKIGHKRMVGCCMIIMGILLFNLQ